jgi:CRISPR-associated endonuclease/helicase Cas3
MVDAAAGGYDPNLGFDATLKGAVPCLPPAEPDAHMPDTPDEDAGSRRRGFVPLTEHLARVEGAAAALCTGIGEDPAGPAAAVVRAARWHDVGKAHPEFQARLTWGCDEPIPAGGPFAKSGISRFDYKRKGFRRYFRHELASALAFLAHAAEEADRDLVAYLVAAHHGKVRTAIRALPDEPEPEEPGRRFARGIWDGETLPALDIAGKERLPETALSLAVMELGLGPHGPSWTERVQRLLADLGPFRLAWYEALVRLADWQASDEEETAKPAGETADA